MSDLSEIQQIRAELEAIKATLRELTPTLERAKQQLDTFKALEQVALRYLLVLRRAGLPDKAGEIIATLSRIVVAARQAQITILALQTAAGPIGWLLAGAGVAYTALTTADILGGF